MSRRALLVLCGALAMAPAAAQQADPAAESLDELLAAPLRVAPASTLARRPDERRPANQKTIEVFGRPMSLGGQLEVSHQTRRDFDLDPQAARDRGRLDMELKLEALYRPSDAVTVFAQAIGNGEWDTHRDSGARQRQHDLERGQTWILVRDPGGLPLSVQAGRIGLVEPRTWWWDDNLDALRVFAGGADWQLEAGLGREMARLSSASSHIAPELNGVIRTFARATWEWRRRHALEAFALFADDRSTRPRLGDVGDADDADAADGRLRWFGLRARGDARFADRQRLGYWTDLAWVRGDETLAHFANLGDLGGNQVRVGDVSTQKVRGSAIDAGAMWTFAAAWQPTLTVGWARGSGDALAGDGVDGAYRQTGMQENKGRYRGVQRFRYYGEMLRPDLSNLAVATLAGGLRFRPHSSLDLVVHDYRQVELSPVAPGSRLDANPEGHDRRLGREIDLILGIRESATVEFAAILGVFRSGPAFGARQGRTARLLELSVTLVF